MILADSGADHVIYRFWSQQTNPCELHVVRRLGDRTELDPLISQMCSHNVGGTFSIDWRTMVFLSTAGKDKERGDRARRFYFWEWGPVHTPWGLSPRRGGGVEGWHALNMGPVPANRLCTFLL